jgi:DNA-binding NarL/FixJ family response regulator
VNTFLARVIAARDAEHDERMKSVRFQQLPKNPTGCQRKQGLGPEDTATTHQREMAARRVQVRRLRAEGLTFTAIASELKLTERQVRTAAHSEGNKPWHRAP